MKGMNQHILVTGAAGLIGRYLVKKLIEEGHYVVGFDLGEQIGRAREFFDPLAETGRLVLSVGTIMDRSGIALAMKGADTVYHLAAMMGHRRTEENRLRCLDINIMGTEQVVAAAVANGARHVVYMSSAAVYGEPDRNPVPESADTKPTNVYGISKLAAEEVVKGYSQLFPSVGYTVVRLFNAYGDDVQGQIALNAFVSRVIDGRNPVIYGDGSQKRCYTHVQDVCAALVCMLRNPTVLNKTYNIANPAQVFAHRDLAQTVIDVLAPRSGLVIEFQAKQSVGEGREIMASYGDASYAKMEMGFEARITIEQGLRRIGAAMRPR